jgi:MinD-like ATPase involved in chromosome partitioning or flagellar assembly
MAKIVSVHSFRGGTGKSNITANVAAALAIEGQRVGIVDTDIQSPGIHILCGVNGNQIHHSLNEFLNGTCPITETAHPVLDDVHPGKVFLIPSSVRADDIVQILRSGYDIRLLSTAIRELIETLQLDTLLIDTHPGLNEEALLALAISTTVAIVMRPDQQDYEGTAVTVDVARSLDVPHMVVIVNNVPQEFDAAQLQSQIEKVYNCPVAAVLPHSDEMMSLASGGIFMLKYPDHPLSSALGRLAKQLTTP